MPVRLLRRSSRPQAKPLGQGGVGPGIPRFGVDAVEDADEGVTTTRQQGMEPGPGGRGADLIGVVRTHRDDAVGQRDGPTERIARPTDVKRGPTIGAQSIEPAAIAPPLIREVVQGEHRRDLVVEEADHRRGVPVIQVNHVDLVGDGESRHGGREGEEPLIVVRPTVGFARWHVGVRTANPRHIDERDLAVAVEHAGAGRSELAGPDRKADGLDALVGEAGGLRSAVIRHDQIDPDTVATQRLDEPAGGLGQSADTDEGGKLRGGEKDVGRTCSRHGDVVRGGRSAGGQRAAANEFAVVGIPRRTSTSPIRSAKLSE